MKRLFILTSALFSFALVSAQDTVVAKVIAEEPATVAAPAKEKKFEFKPYGFVRNYFYYDSRQTYSSIAGLYEQIPKDEAMSIAPDGSEYDSNSESESNFLAITTRLGLDISSKFNKTNATAKIEADFCGATGSNFLIRLRQAYFKLDWKEKRHTLLLGQAWHPMTGDLPDVLALASGSPFQPFSRTPQMRYDYKPGKLNFTAAALWQFQFKSVGPTGYDPKYNKIPECFLGFDFAKNGFKIGTGVDILSVTPRTSTSDSMEVNGKKTLVTVGVDERLTSFSPILYVNYKKNKFAVKAKGVFGENTAHLNMYSGYGPTEMNEDGSYEYSPLRNISTWADVSYGSTWKFNLFGGFFKNLGSSEELKAIYIRNSVKNIDYIWRICPAVTYNMKGMTIGLEYELTNVGYGNVDEYGKAEADRDVKNNRLCMMLKYAW